MDVINAERVKKTPAKSAFRPVKLASVVIRAILAGAVVFPLNIRASDVEIYKPARTSTVNLVLVIDASASMGIKDASGVSPLDRVKSAVQDMMTSTDPALTNLNLAVVVYPYNLAARAISDNQTPVPAWRVYPNNKINAGYVLVTAARLGEYAGSLSGQRKKIFDSVSQLQALGDTVTMPAYAEAVAYLVGAPYNRTTGYYYAGGYSPYRDRVALGTTKWFGSDYFGDGYQLSDPASWQADGVRYKSPLSNPQECDSQGVMMVTGSPGPYGVDAGQDGALLKNATQNLAASGSYSDGYNGFVPPNGYGYNGWIVMGPMARYLNDPTNIKNGLNISIKTGVLGIGPYYANLKPAIDGSADCSNSKLTQNERNFCRMGTKYGVNWPNAGGRQVIGDGGVYAGDSSQQVLSSITNFVLSLNNSLPSLITTPFSNERDRLNGQYSEYLYLPVGTPQPGKDFLVWPGNLKKYRIAADGNSIEDKNGLNIFDQTVGPNYGQLVSRTDFWGTGADNANTGTGGIFPKIPLPSTTTPAAVRNVLVENGLQLVRATESNVRDATFSYLGDADRRALLNYMGYPVSTSVSTPVTDAELSTARVPAATNSTRILGASLHSPPVKLVYNAPLDPTTGAFLPDKAETYLLYGSTDGGLHMVSETNGAEQFVMLPRSLLATQSAALVANNTGVEPFYDRGMDGPWTSDIEYTVRLSGSSSSVTAKTVHAFGGMGRGGDGYYGLNLSTPVSPKLVFSINRTLANGSTSEYTRMGQTWGKPVMTTIRNVTGKLQKILLLPGGYDTSRYDSTDTNRVKNDLIGSYESPDIGNAIYMVGPYTGALLRTVSNSANVNPGKTLFHSTMNYSVVGAPVPLDINGDGITDVAYFADLGGQVFRIDFGRNYVVRRIADFSVPVTTGNGQRRQLGPRFYESPTVTFQKEGNTYFAVVSVASGDRSNPLDQTVPGGMTPVTSRNRIYNIIDRDVMRPDLLTTLNSETAVMRTGANLSNTKNLYDGDFEASVGRLKGDYTNTNMLQGWYLPVRAFTWSNGESRSGSSDGDAANYLKVFNSGLALNNKLYFSVFSPDTSRLTRAQRCSAHVEGETNIYKLCLPYGVCDDKVDGVRKGLVSIKSLGQGIQHTAIVPVKKLNMTGLTPTERQAACAANPCACAGQKVLHDNSCASPAQSSSSNKHQFRLGNWYELQ